MPFSSLIIIGAGLMGLGISLYIHYKKSTRQKLVCLIGETCTEVVGSRYGNMFGISNEIFGIVYYGFVVMVVAFRPLFPLLQLQTIVLALSLATGLAAGFSIVLIGIQMFILKKWCDWCVISSALSIFIFILTVYYG